MAGQTPPGTSGRPANAAESRISPEEQRKLFASVDQILAFASADTALPIRYPVKRKLLTRAAVKQYVLRNFETDKGSERLQRSELVLKKFGLLPRSFRLRPFLVSLLTEQIAGFYDAKTKTVNLLDWIAPDDQKPVLAHELTHALQDQHVDLEHWGDQSPEDVPKDVSEDIAHLVKDEGDNARDAVAEGQAMAVFLDYGLKPSGKSVRTEPEIASNFAAKADAKESPVLAAAPLVLQETLAFPYEEGLRFEQSVWKDKGTAAAFAGTLDRPPSTSYEVLHPHAYEAKATPPMLRMGDLHPLLEPAYRPYDIGAMGEFDLQLLTRVLGGEDVAALFTQQWDGGLYYAAQRKDARAGEGTAGIGLVYLSRWKTAAAASAFAELYGRSLKAQYTDAQAAEGSSGAEQVWQTEEGPVLIEARGKYVFVSASFAVSLARELEAVLLSAQEEKVAGAEKGRRPAELGSSLARALAGFGVMRCALPGAATRR